jgi:hypothetical protein
VSARTTRKAPCDVPLLVLWERAEARALLLGAGEFASFDEAIAPLIDYAHQTGLLERLGARAVYDLICCPFTTIHEAGHG